MALQPTDKFVIQRGGSYRTVKFETIAKEVDVPLAIQTTDLGPGTKGLVYPGNTIDYDQNTGEFNVNVPTGLRFIDIITEDYQQPRPIPYNNGDFYLVSIPEDQTVQLNASDWPGIDGQEYTKLQLSNGGTVYRANAGYYEGLGGIADTGTVFECETNNIASGLALNARVEFGRIYVDSIEISPLNPGENFEVDDTFTIGSAYSAAVPARFKVTETGPNGSVTKIAPIQYGGDPDDGYNEEYIGYGFQLNENIRGELNRVRTSARTGYGSGLVVDCIVEQGRIESVAISPFSQHNNYRDGDTVVIHDSTDSAGDALITIEIESDSVGYVAAHNDDKIVYRAADIETGTEAAWIHVESGKSDISLLGINALFTGRQPADGSVYYNSNLALEFDYNNVTRFTAIGIKNASYTLMGNMPDPANSHSGLFAPYEKLKLDSVEEGATPGKVNQILTQTDTDKYYGDQYNILKIDNVETTAGTDVTITPWPAGPGRRGVVSTYSDEDVAQSILSAASDANEGVHENDEDSVISGNHTCEYFMPKNLYALRKLY